MEWVKFETHDFDVDAIIEIRTIQGARRIARLLEGIEYILDEIEEKKKSELQERLLSENLAIAGRLS